MLVVFERKHCRHPQRVLRFYEAAKDSASLFPSP